MIPYYAIAVIVGFTSLAAHFSGRYFSSLRGEAEISSPRFTFFDLVSVAVLVAFSGVRASVGTDYDMYSRLFLTLPDGALDEAVASSPQEIGYTVLSFVVKQYSDSPFWVFLVASILSVVPVYVALKRTSTNLPLAVVLYILLAFYVIPFNIVRQGVAMALSFYASRFVDKDRRLFVILNVIAATFHSSALLVALLQYLARNIVPSKKMLVIVLGVSLGLLGVFGSLRWARDLVALLNPRYETYIDGSQTAGLGTILSLAVSVGLIIYSLILPSDDSVRRFQTYMILGIPFLVAGIVATPIARIQYYFAMFVLLALPNQIARVKTRALNSVGILVVSVVYFTFFLLSFGGLLPYRVDF